MENTQAAIAHLEGLIRDTNRVLPICSPELRRQLEEQRGYYELAAAALRGTERPERGEGSAWPSD